MSGTSLTSWREIVVLNESPHLRHEGDWVSARTTTHMTPLSDRLLTVTEGKKGSIFYEFSRASRLVVQGYYRTPSTKNGEHFNLACAVEPEAGTQVTVLQRVSGWSYDSYALCEVQNLSPSTNYILNITLESIRGQEIWFDALRLDPEPAANLDDALVNMHHQHPMIQYDAGWENGHYPQTRDVAHFTNKTGSIMKLDFNGTSLKWYTLWNVILDPQKNLVSEASWRLDNGEAHKFITNVASDVFGFQSHQLIFEIANLSPGLHHLEVTHHGNESSRPLSLSNLVIQSAVASVSSTMDLPIPSMDGSSGGLSNSTKIAIALSTSITALVVLAVILVFLYRNQRGVSRRKEDEDNLDNSRNEPISSSSLQAMDPTTSLKGTPVMSSEAYPHEAITITFWYHCTLQALELARIESILSPLPAPKPSPLMSSQPLAAGLDDLLPPYQAQAPS
ncbi:hypothetical protein CVT24_009155 [Panaeolus cyanescens]|uniref:Uncharacterized protein n=1 Tax=Panaeolus cyanescens TaxID=181874 RepID=A0A409Y8V4_9AGAR|nr:hypothetical protein CVT24_009155 [Panaeolus cyanescens]